MKQLILDMEENLLVLPESKKGGYTVREESLLEDVPMISGRMVREYRGKVWRITHQNGYLSEADMVKFINACEKGMSKSILCSFLVQGETEMRSSVFIVTAYTRPKFMWSRVVAADGTEKTVPLWGDYSVELREVKPHD